MLEVIIVLLCMPGYIMAVYEAIRDDPLFTIREK